MVDTDFGSKKCKKVREHRECEGSEWTQIGHFIEVGKERDTGIMET